MWQTRVEEEGFAIMPDALPAAVVSQLVQECTQMTFHRNRAGVRHALRHPAVAGFAKSPQLLGIVQQILGDNAIPFRATLFDKSPSANWLVAWHQDTALPLREKCELPGWGPWSIKEGVVYAHAPAEVLSQVLALRIHFDDSTPLNGPLRVRPGTHALGVLSDETIHKLSEGMEAVDCLVPKGGILAMRPLLLHSSSKLQAETRRRILHIEYAASADLPGGLKLAVA